MRHGPFSVRDPARSEREAQKMGGEGEKRAEGKGEKERLSFSPNSLFPPLLSLFAAYRLGPVSDNQFLVFYIASRVRINCLL